MSITETTTSSDHTSLCVYKLTFPPVVWYLVGHGEGQRRTSDGGAVGHGSQHQAGLSQQVTGEGLQDGGRRLHGFGGGCSGGIRVGGLGVELRRDHGEGLRHGGDCSVEHFLPGFFHLSKEGNNCWTSTTKESLFSTQTNIVIAMTPTSSGDQLMPCLSLCVVNHTLICSSGCLEAAVSQESSACVG